MWEDEGIGVEGGVKGWFFIIGFIKIVFKGVVEFFFRRDGVYSSFSMGLF